MTADTTYTPPEQVVAIVTGAGRGIGAAIAERLGADGMAVACLDIEEATAKQTADRLAAQGVRAAAYAADVSDEDAVERVVGEVAETLGPPTVLVNNAGVLRDNLLFKMSASDWDTVMSVHLRGTFLMTRAAQKHMIDAGHGRIVNLSSTSALGNRGQANYAAAKAALHGATRSLAREMAGRGITANVVAPGVIEGAMAAGAFPPDHVKQLVPAGRAGTPDEVAALVGFLCSDAAGYVNGQVIGINGGMG
jgi:3-oxoacyl-[acyl-carrier protein] reductase